LAKKQFKAESKRMLDLMIHSIYTNRDIFLRELISNASDALDKLHYASLTDSTLSVSREDLKITLTADKDAGTIIVSDNGIGMTKEELEQNLGTIAKSGTLQFRESLEEAAEVDVIGQFGVGFYSAFMVAQKLDVFSRKAGEDVAHHWSSAGVDGYTVEPCDKDTCGTTIVITIKDDGEDDDYSTYLDQHKISALVRKYSDYIRYPIEMMMERTRMKEKPADAPEDASPEWETYQELAVLNSMVPLWQRPKAELTEEDYFGFYKKTFMDFSDPAAMLHTSAEGTVSFKALLYVPAAAPHDFYTREYEKGLALYSSSVMIMEKCGDLLPDHFRFVRGIVDSQDFSLNISRELLQQTRELKIIRQNLEKKIKNELSKLMEADREKYEEFWRSFGRQLKYGVVDEYGANKDLLQDLLLFPTSHADGKPSTLAEYVSRMPEEQSVIYYSAGESVTMAAAVPQCERVRNAGFEVIYFTEEVDEFIVQTLTGYQEKTFKSVLDEDALPENEEEKKALESKNEENKDLLDFIKETLGEGVNTVRLSANLGSHAAALNYEGPVSLEMEKYFAKIDQDMMGMPMKAERVLEINPDSPSFALLQDGWIKERPKAEKVAKVLYQQALLAAGLPLENPTEFNSMVWELFS